MDESQLYHIVNFKINNNNNNLIFEVPYTDELITSQYSLE